MMTQFLGFWNSGVILEIEKKGTSGAGPHLPLISDPLMQRLRLSAYSVWLGFKTAPSSTVAVGS